MDDPLSALDSNVKKKIFKHVIKGELQNTTRILVTHVLEFLEEVDVIIYMDKGKILCSGSLDDIRDHPKMIDMLLSF